VRARDATSPNAANKAWVPTAEVFQRFLEWLDGGVDSGGAKYVDMRRRLVWYFQRKLCASPDELADETLHRIARRLDEQGAISEAPPARYCYIVARYVFLEYLREAGAQRKASRQLQADLDARFDSANETLLDCLDRCLEELSEGDRRLILEYYRGEQRTKIESRRALAVRLDLTSNALSIRACRIRNRLEACVKRCSADE
jgi:DNA-directed RNA polymerase specialized sigma24 family protein